MERMQLNAVCRSDDISKVRSGKHQDDHFVPVERSAMRPLAQPRLSP